MAVEFQRPSEYEEKFRVHPLSQSASFHRQPDKAMKPAGKQTLAEVKTEPAIQQKKRVTHAPTASLSSEFFEKPLSTDSEYILLGNQDKFSKNVKYWNKPFCHTVSPAKAPKVSDNANLWNTMKNPGKLESVPNGIGITEDKSFENMATPQAPRRHKSMNADNDKETSIDVAADDEKNRPLKADKIRRILEKEMTFDKENVNNNNLDSDLKSEVQKSKKSRRNTRKKILHDVKKNLDFDNKRSSESKKIDTSNIIKEHTNEKAKQAKEKIKQGIKKNLNEFIDQEKRGIKKSHDESKKTGEHKRHSAQDPDDNNFKSDKSLRYKAGIHRPVTRPVRQSEYQRQFEWKNAILNSPIISAEQIVHGQKVTVPIQQAVASETEYKREFKPWIMPRQSRSDSHQTSSEVQSTHVSSKKKKAKRSKSMEPSHKIHDIEDKAKKIRKKPRYMESEYNQNFKSPMLYEYKSGAWKDLSPPKEDTNNCYDNSQSWYKEVLELREKASEYRKRAQGTHFSREHLVQLMAQQAHLWEDISSRSSLEPLALETSSVSSLHTQRSKLSANEQSCVDYFPEKAKPSRTLDNAWTDHKKEDALSISTSSSPQSQKTPKGQAGSSRSEPMEGCVPTPTLGAVRQSRHHFDRTTPSVGGALLVSPPRVKLPTKHNIQPVVSEVNKANFMDKNDETDLNGSDSMVILDEASPRASSTTVTPRTAATTPTKPPRLDLSNLTPTFGSPSYDSHCIRDDDASSDRPLQTQYVHSPVKSASNLANHEQAKTEPAYKGKYVSKSKFSNLTDKSHKHDVSISLPLSKERLEQFDKQQLLNGGAARPLPADDSLSVSASSTYSLASEVLERAQKRRNFWNEHLSATK